MFDRIDLEIQYFLDLTWAPISPELRKYRRSYFMSHICDLLLGCSVPSSVFSDDDASTFLVCDYLILEYLSEKLYLGTLMDYAPFPLEL